MTTYRVTFKNGDSYTRKTDRTYTHAWRLYDTNAWDGANCRRYDGWWHGAKFSGSLDNAKRAVRSTMKMSDTYKDFEIAEVIEV